MKNTLLILVCILGNFLAYGNDWKASFEQANQLYEQGEYENAFTIYSTLAQSYSSFELYYNTGNAAYKSNQLGQSILYFERAKKINPTSEDLLANLAIANSKVKDRIEELPNLGVEDAWGILTATKRLNFWSWLTILLTFIGMGLLAVSLWMKRGSLKKTAFGIGLAVTLFSFAAYGLSRATYNNELKNTTGVVLEPKVEVKTGPSSNEQNAFLLHEGTTVKIVQQKENWAEIKLANGNVGWIEMASIELV